MNQTAGKRLRVPEMEGAQARWYARLRGSDSQMRDYREQATRLTSGLPDGAQVLEVAPGPGYHARRALSMLRRRAYTPDQFMRLAAGSAFGDAEITSAGIGLEVRLVKR